MRKSMLDDPSSAASPLTRRSFLAGGVAALGLAAYGASHGRHHLEVVRISIPIRDLPDAFLGFRLVQISDIHLKEFTEPWFMEHAIDLVNGLKPDLVVFTGDLISHGPLPLRVALEALGIGAEILTRIKCPQRFACLGNHDVTVDKNRVIDTLEAHGTPVLQDTFVALQRGGDRLWLSGTRDATWQRPILTDAIPTKPKAPVILLAHEPDFADYVAVHERGAYVDLMLSGHSHGGQVRLPLAGPLILPPLGRKYPQGLYRVGSMSLYTNRGIGTVGMPFRLNCPPEITEITLRRT